jgi:hypothetical protein
MKRLGLFAIGLLAGCTAAGHHASPPGSVSQRAGGQVGRAGASIVADRVMKLTRSSAWRLVASVPIAFRTHHPQGMVKIGDTFFVSAVEVTVPTRRFPAPEGGHDRDPGEGVGHVFKFDGAGHLITDLKIGEGTIYHPGGLDYDGVNIWVPVAEYRPDSRSIVYRVDPGTMQATEVFRYPDHIGAMVRDTDANTLHGISWGSRRFYRWTLGRSGTLQQTGGAPNGQPAPNTSHYVDYQDCKYGGAARMLCTGVSELRQKPHSAVFRLGGIDLVSLRDARPLHQVPLLLWTDGGLDMTHNPVWLEAVERGLRGYFMPDDDTSILYVYEVQTD